MPSLSIEKTYQDGVTPTSSDLDNICDSLEVFLNVTKLGSDNIADNSITASSTLVAGSITADKIQNLAVTTAKIADNAATAAKFATGAVTTAKIIDANVTTAKIAASAVTSAKLADNAITAAKKATQAKVTATGTVNSTGTPVYGGTATVSVTRPILYNCGGGTISLNSLVSGTIMEGSILLQKNSSTIMNQEFKYGPIFVRSGTVSIDVAWPSSALFYIDTTENASDTSTTYRMGCDLTTGTLCSSSGSSNVIEVV